MGDSPIAAQQNAMDMETDEAVSENSQTSPLDSFKKIIDREEIFDADPKEVREAQDAAALASYQNLISKFMETIPSVNAENLEKHLLTLADNLRSLDEEVGAEAVLPGYVGHHVLSQLTVHLVKLLNNHLPRAHRLHRVNATQFVIQIGKRLNPDLFENSGMQIIRWDDLLESDTAQNCMPLISTEVDDDLTLKAQEKIDFLVAKWQALQAKGPVSREDKEKFKHKMNYIQDIWSGHYPYGLNTEAEERWKYFDIGCCMDPAFDNHDYIHELNERNVAYLTRLANDMKHDLIARVKQFPNLADDPVTIAHAARLDAFIQHGTLPKGWRLEDTNVEMENK
jgi:hypothetical protein